MGEIITISVYTVGFLFCVMVLCGLILIFVERTIQEIKRRKVLVLKERIGSYTSELSRWCGGEFPHVEDTCNAIWARVCGERYPLPDQFRKQLRNKGQTNEQN
jgi:hypothetical protein